MTIIDGKDAKTRKAHPLTTGCLDYFPDALLEVAELSKIGNEQHNPGQPLHWAKEKSNDHADCIGRHLLDRGRRDSDGVRHSAKTAWRALALLQTEIDADAKIVKATEEALVSAYNRTDRRKGGTDRRKFSDTTLRNKRTGSDNGERLGKVCRRSTDVPYYQLPRVDLK